MYGLRIYFPLDLGAFMINVRTKFFMIIMIIYNFEIPGRGKGGGGLADLIFFFGSAQAYSYLITEQDFEKN